MKQKKFIKSIFDELAPHYDRVSSALAFRIDKKWRSDAAKIALNSTSNVSEAINSKEVILDVACGTGELTKELTENGAENIIAIDISPKMLEHAKRKIKNANFIVADAHALPFKDNVFACITIAFGLRNFENFLIALDEIKRVLKENGRFVILDLGKPDGVVGRVYYFYIKKIMPEFAKIYVKNNRAYKYLPESLEKFPESEKLKEILREKGFKEIEIHPRTCGIVCIFVSRA